MTRLFFGNSKTLGASVKDAFATAKVARTERNLRKQEQRRRALPSGHEAGIRKLQSLWTFESCTAKSSRVQEAAWEGLNAFKAIAAGVKISSMPVLHERTGIVVRDYGMSLRFGASLRPNVSLRASMKNAETNFFAKDLGGEIVATQSNIVIDCKDLCMGEKQFKMDLQLFAEKKEEKAMVDIASANEELLMTLPGIGAEKAKAIVEYRNANGIRKAEDLLNVKGISAKKLALIMNMICVKGEDVMAQKIVQEFKASLNNNTLLHEMKQGEGNGTVYKVSLFPTVDGFMAAKLAPTSVQITPVNKGFFKKNLKMQNVIGERTIVKLGCDRLCVLDTSNLVSGAVDDNAAIETVGRISKGFYLADIEGKVRVLVPATGVRGEDVYRDISTVEGRIFEKEELFDEKGPKDGVLSFAGAGGLALGTPSQFRKIQLTCFCNNTQKDVEAFARAMAQATLDEYELNQKRLKVVDPKTAAEVCTRDSSKHTRFGLTFNDGCEVNTYAIVFEKDDEMDGRFAWTARVLAEMILAKRGNKTDKNVARLEKALRGYLIQSRPYTVKAAGLALSQKALDMELASKKLLRIDVNTASDELLADVQTMLSKALRSKMGTPESLKNYDGVVICHNGIDAPIDMWGDLNAFKDQYDLRRKDGANILAIAHMDRDNWMKAGTSAQLLKIVLAAVKSVGSKELNKDLRNTLTRIIARQIEMDANYESDERKLGHEMIDCSFVPDVVRMLNPHSLINFPSVFKSTIDDTVRTMQNHIMLDSYGTEGHFGMLTCDPCYVAWGESILSFDGDIAEVIDPAWDRYSATMGVTDNRGIGIKHPAMGTREVILNRYIGLAISLARVEALGRKLGKSDADIEEMKDTYRNLKEGVVIIPADLWLFACIAAGSDLDGDKAGFHFISPIGLDVVHLVWAAYEAGTFKPRAVDIGNDGQVKEKEITVDDAIFQTVLSEIIKTGNKSVGAITNSFRLLVEPLQQDNDTIRRVFTSLFVKVFEAGTEGKEKYVSCVHEVMDEKRGVVIYKTDYTVLQQVEEAIKKMDVTWENIMAAINDLDVVGRHIQELTIDAAKKFYKVLCDFIDALNKEFKLLPLTCGIEFDMKWNDHSAESHVELKPNDGYVMSVEKVDGEWKFKVDFKMSYTIKKRKNTVTVFADAFAPFRAFATRYAATKLNVLRNFYMKVAFNDEMMAERAARFSSLRAGFPAEAVARLDYVKDYIGKTAKHIYASYMNAMRKANIVPGMDIKERLETERAVRQHVNEEYGFILDGATNELRKVAKDFGIVEHILIEYVSNGSDALSNFAANLLKEELCRYVARQSEIKNVTRTFKGAKAEMVKAASFNGKIEVENGMVTKSPVEADLVDGIYTVEVVDENTVNVVRPVEELIEVPEADNSMAMVKLFDKGNYKAIDALDAGTEIELHLCKVNKNGRMFDTLGVFVDGEYVTEAWAGDFSTKESRKAWAINAAYYDGMVGNLVRIDSAAEEKGNRGNQRDTLITLENVHVDKKEVIIVGGQTTQPEAQNTAVVDPFNMAPATGAPATTVADNAVANALMNMAPALQ